MATASIVLPIHDLDQEHRRNKHKSPRYYRPKWGHLTISIENAKDALTTAIPYLFYVVFLCIPIACLCDALGYEFDGLHWDETQGVYLDRLLEVLWMLG
jgi:hypothetical protein